MGDTDEQLIEKPFHVDRAKTGRASCKKCKQKIAQGELRFAKLGHNPFGSGTMKMWHHIPCIFEVFKNQRASTKKIESPEDIGGWFDIGEEDQKEIINYFPCDLKEIFSKQCTSFLRSEKSPSKEKEKTIVGGKKGNTPNKDMSFRAFCKLCAQVAEAASYITKTKIIKEFFTHGCTGTFFKGDIEMWCRLLLPGVIKRNYNLQSKQLIKIFSRIFGTKQEDMLEHLEKGDVADTISVFFEKSKICQHLTRSTLSLYDVDEFLETLSTLTKEVEQTNHFTNFLKKCTVNDLRMIIRLIKHDLRINSGAKHVLGALHPDAYKAFQTTRDIKSVVANALNANMKSRSCSVMKGSCKGMDVNLKVMTPILPMLAKPCKSVEMALKKCPNGMFSEIKYDGERIQLHKEGNKFKFFSRSLKPVLAHKVNHFKDYVPLAFPHAQDLILDAEILMVNRNGEPLPFGTLGIHKKNSFKDASVCLFVFDCIYYNGESLIDEPIKKRREILEKSMVEIKNHIVFSEKEEIGNAEDLEAMITKVFRLGLEGLILKDLKSKYEPGKRHWLKIKKDYLFEGAMADTADLVVLGAWFGTGNKGGIMSIFLMGCHDPAAKTWRTVTKVHSGHDDSTLERLQSNLKMVKISKDPGKVPSWLKCTRTMVPDFVAKDPYKMPVWEITGAEFTRNVTHTADGISIRFPRVTRIRRDKDWKTATNLPELRELYEKSKDMAHFTLKTMNKDQGDETSDMEMEDVSSSPRKQKPANVSSESGSPSPKKVKLFAGRCDDDDDDTDTDREAESIESLDRETVSNPLPDSFKSCVIQMPINYKENDFLRRYLIAYGAVLHDPNKKTSVENSEKKVTHVVHVKWKSPLASEKYWAEDVRHVHINWIWDSIKLLERQKEEKYVISCIKRDNPARE